MFDAILVIAFVVIYLTTVWYYERRLVVLDELLIEQARSIHPLEDSERPMLRYLSERQRAEQPFNVIDLTKGK